MTETIYIGYGGTYEVFNDDGGFGVRQCCGA